MTATDTTTTTTTVAPAPARPRKARPSAVPIPGRPVIAGAANAATIAGATLVNFAGPGALAVAAVAAVTVAGAGAVSRARTSRRSNAGMRRAASPRTPGTRSLGMPRLGGGRAAPSGGRAAAGRASTGSTGGRSRLWSLLGRPGAGSPKQRQAKSSPGAATRNPPATGKLAAARRKLAARRQAGPRLSDAIRAATAPNATGKRPTARQAWSDARKAITGDQPKRRGVVRRATAGLAAAGLAATKTAWDARQRRKKAAAARAAKNARAQARKQAKQPVGTTVRRPTGYQPGQTSTAPTATPAAKPAPINPTPGSQPATAGGTMSVRQLLALSEDFLAAAMRDQPEGMLQVTTEAHIIPQVLENLAKAMKIRYDRAQGHPMHNSIKDAYGAVHKASMAVVKSSLEIGPALERLHKDELERLRNPRLRGDESMWDVRANRDA